MTQDIEVIRAWLRGAYVIATIGALSIPIVYSFSPWRRSSVGRVIMLLGVSLAAAMVLTLLFSVWPTAPLTIRFIVSFFIISMIAVATFSTAYVIWRLNYTKRKQVFVILTGKAYDFLKRVAQIWLPAAGTLYFGLGQIWGLPAVEEVIGTITAVDAFLGVGLGVSTKNYEQSGQKYGGQVSIKDNEDETSTLSFKGLDSVTLASKPEITLKIVRE